MSDKIDDIENNPALVAYKPSNGVTEYQVIIDSGAETIWATEQQIAGIFDKDRTVIGRHIRNSFKEAELDKNSVSAKFAHTAEDGKTYQVNQPTSSSNTRELMTTTHIDHQLLKRSYGVYGKLLNF